MANKWDVALKRHDGLKLEPQCFRLCCNVPEVSVSQRHPKNKAMGLVDIDPSRSSALSRHNARRSLCSRHGCSRSNDPIVRDRDRERGRKWDSVGKRWKIRERGGESGIFSCCSISEFVAALSPLWRWFVSRGALAIALLAHADKLHWSCCPSVHFKIKVGVRGGA